MTVYIDIKYSNLISSRLELYKVISSSPFKAVARCPLCGDSQKNKYKTRGYFLQFKDRVVFKCHNCGVSTNLKTILERVDPNLAREYSVETYREKYSLPEFVHKPTPQVHVKPEILKSLKTISQLRWDHPAKVYVVKRQIPNKFHAKLYYCSKFKTWTNSLIPDKIKSSSDEPRLIIPLIDSFGRLFGYTGRSFDPASKTKYITIILDPSKPKIYGLDSIDMSKRNYITEGPIDSMFLPNAIAMTGSDFDPKHTNYNTVVVYDNEPRNKEIVNKIESALTAGLKVCIWPDTIQQKDINDMVMSGMTPEKVLNIIDSNTVSGLTGNLKLNSWRKV